ncbi:MAG TPA: 16S rRNA (uracil(1498)-N(3))-methyltransferase, partial [Gammaproteobacteria bacterium]|nr:16S rRNA (uracil(1498)-N(3))-methyltransferase [Gammaproteobacteria bacterium]
GFSKAELALAEKSRFTRVTLGPRILRTETAPVAALAVVQHLLGN